MKLVFRFAAVFFVVSLVAIGLSGFFLAQHGASRLESSVSEDLADYGRGVAHALEVSWREGGYERARALLAGFEGSSDVELAMRRDERVDRVVVETMPGDGTERVIVRMPVAGPAGDGATLELSRAAPTRGALLRAELGAQLVTAVVLALAMAVIAAILGGMLIGRPLDRIVAQARRIGAGDFSQRLRSTGRDEIGALKRELNVMCEQLVAAHARAEDEASARAEALEQMRHLDRLRTAGTIASSIAHELGTPLSILLLRGQTLATDPLPAAEVAAAGKTVIAQVTKMTTIVRQLLDFTRAKNATGEPEATVDITGVVERATDLLDGIAKKQGLVLCKTTPLRPALVRGRAQQLEQALTNLVVNAMQASRRGDAIDLRVDVREPAGAVPQVVIEVVDTGHGMDGETMQRIFEPFFTTKDVGQGTGLGLHVARGIIEDHGGAVTVASELGRGTRFTVALPRVN